MASTRDIKRRIKSVNNTKKITKAMEMISSVKMRKAVGKVTASRPYATLAWEILREVTSRKKASHHQLLERKTAVKKAVAVVISSNRGLCGSLNQQVLKKADELGTHIRQQFGCDLDIIALGKKTGRALAKRGYHLAAEYPKPDAGESLTDIQHIMLSLVDEYTAGKVDKVYVVYTDFISSLKQVPQAKQLLPFTLEEDTALGTIGSTPPSVHRSPVTRYKFEPDTATILSQIIPRILESQLYQALLESNASEHSARMAAMRNASDSARDMIDEFTLIYNQARQASITREIAEIAAGKAALE